MDDLDKRLEAIEKSIADIVSRMPTTPYSRCREVRMDHDTFVEELVKALEKGLIDGWKNCATWVLDFLGSPDMSTAPGQAPIEVLESFRVFRESHNISKKEVEDEPAQQ